MIPDGVRLGCLAPQYSMSFLGKASRIIRQPTGWWLDRSCYWLLSNTASAETSPRKAGSALGPFLLCMWSCSAVGRRPCCDDARNRSTWSLKSPSLISPGRPECVHFLIRGCRPLKDTVCDRLSLQVNDLMPPPRHKNNA